MNNCIFKLFCFLVSLKCWRVANIFLGDGRKLNEWISVCQTVIKVSLELSRHNSPALSLALLGSLQDLADQTRFYSTALAKQFRADFNSRYNA